MTAPKVTITLKDAEDWLEWIEVVKSTAIGLDVWDCINPEKTKDGLRVPSKPEWPTLSTVKVGATGIKDLDENERFQYKLLQKRYEREISEYETSKKGLGTIRIEIQKSVSWPNLQYTFRKETPYDMLVALRNRYAPSDATRIRELKLKYEGIKNSTPQRESIDDWLQKWETTYTECMDYKISDVQENGAIWDFVRATERIQPDFSNIWIAKLLDSEKAAFPDLYEIVNKFRLYRREKAAQAKIPDLAFATFKGQSDNQSNERSAATQSSESKGKGIYRSKKEGRKYTCFCGREHRWSECYYVNEAVRPNGWKPNPGIQKRMNEKLEEEPFFRNKITEIKKRSLEKKDESKNPIVREAFWTVGSSFYSNRSRLLKDSFLLDSASDSHICNSRERFSNLTPAGEDCCVAGGGGDVKVHGFGTVVIRPKGATPNIDCELTLNDVAYVPEFPVNLVSYDKAMSKGIYWNGEEKTLVKDGKPICKVERKYDQWLLEYNPISVSAFATSSESPVSQPPTPESPTTESNETTAGIPEPEKPVTRKRPVRKSVKTPVSKADYTIWHRRMGHLNWEAISHLPDAAIGVQVEGNREKSAVCEPCHLASGIHQVSRRHHHKETEPFARVYYDLIQMIEAYN